MHAGLVPAHLEESTGYAVAFGVATVLLVAVAVAVARRPHDPWPPRVAAALFLGLIAAYIFTRASEPVDALGVITKLVETGGLLLESRRLRPRLDSACSA